MEGSQDDCQIIRMNRASASGSMVTIGSIRALASAWRLSSSKYVHGISRVDRNPFSPYFTILRIGESISDDNAAHMRARTHTQAFACLRKGKYVGNTAMVVWRRVEGNGSAGLSAIPNSRD
jgi:hypothetical protein